MGPENFPDMTQKRTDADPPQPILVSWTLEIRMMKIIPSITADGSSPGHFEGRNTLVRWDFPSSAWGRIAVLEVKSSCLRSYYYYFRDL